MPNAEKIVHDMLDSLRLEASIEPTYHEDAVVNGSSNVGVISTMIFETNSMSHHFDVMNRALTETVGMRTIHFGAFRRAS